MPYHNPKNCFDTLVLRKNTETLGQRVIDNQLFISVSQRLRVEVSGFYDKPYLVENSLPVDYWLVTL